MATRGMMAVIVNEFGELSMPSFDVISEVDLHELTNAVDQASRIVANRFDFKGVEASFERDERRVVIVGEAEFQVEQMQDMLRSALIKCKIDPTAMDVDEMQTSGKQVRQNITLRHGLSTDECRKIVKHIKNQKMKVQAQIQSEQVRVTGKKRDDLQQVMAMLKEQDFGAPLQFSNFRD